MKKSLPSKLLLILVLAAALIVPTVVYAATGNFSAAIPEDGIAERAGLPDTAEVALSADQTIRVTYDKSRHVREGLADIYKDERGNDYIFKSGRLSGFYSNEIDRPAADRAPIGKDAAEAVALAFLTRFTENADEYTLQSFREKETYGQYYFTFARKLGNLFTDESASVWVMYDGGVKSVSVQNDGKYKNAPESLVAGITESGLLAYAQSELALIYPDAEDAFEMESYSLTRDAQGYYIEICGNMAGRVESVQYELED